MKVSILPLLALLCLFYPQVVQSISATGSFSEIQPRAGGSIGLLNKSPLDVRGGAGKAVQLEKKELAPGQFSIGRILEFHKALWLPVSLAFNYYFKNFSERSCLMAGLFGGYGINWVIKSYTFWDKGFYNDEETGIGGFAFLFLNVCLLNIFFLYPFVAAKNLDPITPVEVLVSTLLYSIGTIFHYGADAQKFYTLKYKGSGLITEAFFSRLHSPSHFGENLIFGSFAIIAGIKKRLTWVPLLYTLLGLFAFEAKKSASLARYKDYEAYKKQTWF